MSLSFYKVSLLLLAKSCLIVTFVYWTIEVFPALGSDKHEEKSHFFRPSLEQGVISALRVSKNVTQPSASQKNAFTTHDADLKSSLLTDKSSHRLKPLAPFVYPLKEPGDDLAEKQKAAVLMADIQHLYNSLCNQNDSDDREEQETVYAQLKQIERKIAEQRKIDVGTLTDSIISLQNYVVKQEEIFGDMAERMPGFKVRKTLKKYNDLNLWLIVRLTLLKHEYDSLHTTFGPSFSQGASLDLTSAPLHSLQATLNILEQEERQAEKTYVKAPFIDFEKPIFTPFNYLLKDEDIFGLELSEHDARKKLQSINHLTLRLIAHLNVWLHKVKLEKTIFAQTLTENSASSQQNEIETIKKQIASLNARLSKLEVKETSEEDKSEQTEKKTLHPLLNSGLLKEPHNNVNNTSVDKKEEARQEALKQIDPSLMQDSELPASVSTLHNPTLRLKNTNNKEKDARGLSQKVPISEPQQASVGIKQESSLPIVHTPNTQEALQKAKKAKRKVQQSSKTGSENDPKTIRPQREIKQSPTALSLDRDVSAAPRQDTPLQKKDPTLKKGTKNKSSLASAAPPFSLKGEEVSVPIKAVSLTKVDKVELALQKDKEAEQAYHFITQSEDSQEAQKKMQWLKREAECNHRGAQNILSRMYFNGEGVSQNDKEAYKWAKRAALQRCHESMKRLGDCYYYGRGIQQSYKEALKWYQEIESDNDKDVLYILGLMHYEGQEVSQDYTKAAQFFLKAAKSGHQKAENEIGCMYYEGQGVDQEYNKAAYWLKEALPQGRGLKHCYCLGLMYYHGRGVSEDSRIAAEWFKKAAENGHLDAQKELGLLYKEGLGVSRDYRQAAHWFRKAADQGHAEAQNQLGLLYTERLGVPLDYDLALKWYKKSAKQGWIPAFINIGRLYSFGQGVEKDLIKAAEWFSKAAERDDSEAQYLLGIMYRDGEGVKKDPAKGAFWFEKAAKGGHARAQKEFATLYYLGQGIPQDYSKAAYWYEKAAHQGYSDIQINIGFLYSTGQGVPQDYTKAAYWYQKAAEKGNAIAQNSLGELYRSGQGVAQDYEKAVYWYKKAAEQGHAGAQQNLSAFQSETSWCVIQ